jgi:TetR/AcrR family transcriptional repressor of nem operon
MTSTQTTTRNRILDAALHVIRAKGYAAMRVEDICAESGLTKGGFFHHFSSKEEMAVAAARYWDEMTGGFFAGAAYHSHADPLDRVLGYIDLRKSILLGDLPDFTCLVGTMVQETYQTNPVIRDACHASISGHAATLVADMEEAAQKYGVDIGSAASLALYTQAAIQGGFILAKASGSAQAAAECIEHLRQYVQLLFTCGQPNKQRPNSLPVH